MRRWLSILLLVVMPLQLSWAAVAAFCAHESSPKAPHFGHHAHAHAQQRSVGVPLDVAKVGALDTVSVSSGVNSGVTSDIAIDISDCHFHGPGVAALPTLIVTPAGVAAAPQTVWTAAAVSAPVLAQPDRPQWARHA